MMSKNGYQQLLGNKDGKNLYWTTDVNVELPIKMPVSGMGAQIKPNTLPRRFKEMAENNDRIALRILRDGNE
jgi:hypothetical protein